MREYQELARLDALFQEMLSLARVTLGLVEQDELEALADTWDRRRRLVKQIATCSRHLAPVFQDWERFLSALDQEQADRAQDLVRSVAQAGGEVAELDQRSGARLETALEEVRRQMRRLNQGTKLVRAYRPLPQGHGGPSRLSRTG